MSSAALGEALKAEAAALGFDLCRIAAADSIPEGAARLDVWLAADHHGTMDWMETRKEQRASPQGLWPDCRSIVMLGMNAGPEHDPLAALQEKASGLIAAYAARRDYHDVIKGKLKLLAQWLARTGGGGVKVFVDTAPVLEKALAAAAGLGWQGKHSVLVSRQHGNWLLLGAIYTTLEIPADAPEQDHCGTCRACLDICPTKAFPAPYQLDARRCISYLTIEHKGHIAREFRAAIGNRVFGCDDCLAVCPWNKFAKAANDAKMMQKPGLALQDLRELARLDDAAFRAMFAGTPVKRTGRGRFIRNVLIAIGNSGDASLATEAERLLTDASPLIRAMAVWALSRLLCAAEFTALRAQIARKEGDADVYAEWAAGVTA